MEHGDDDGVLLRYFRAVPLAELPYSKVSYHLPMFLRSGESIAGGGSCGCSGRRRRREEEAILD